MPHFFGNEIKAVVFQPVLRAIFRHPKFEHAKIARCMHLCNTDNFKTLQLNCDNTVICA